MPNLFCHLSIILVIYLIMILLYYIVIFKSQNVVDNLYLSYVYILLTRDNFNVT